MNEIFPVPQVIWAWLTTWKSAEVLQERFSWTLDQNNEYTIDELHQILPKILLFFVLKNLEQEFIKDPIVVTLVKLLKTHKTRVSEDTGLIDISLFLRLFFHKLNVIIDLNNLEQIEELHTCLKEFYKKLPYNLKKDFIYKSLYFELCFVSSKTLISPSYLGLISVQEALGLTESLLRKNLTFIKFMIKALGIKDAEDFLQTLQNIPWKLKAEGSLYDVESLKTKYE